MELVISVVIGILIVEAYAWLPKISEWLIEWAVQRVRSEDQDRCREEWKADLDALPNSIFKFVHALSNLSAPHRINADFFEDRLTEINALIEECGYKHSRYVMSFRAAKETLGTLEQKLNLIKPSVMELSNKDVAPSFQRAVTAADVCVMGYQINDRWSC